MFQRAKDGDLSDTDTLILLEKLGKAATNAMAEKTVTRAVNQDLVDATKKREKRKHQNREDGADGSYARVMGREELLHRREFGIEKRFEAAWKDFFHAGFAMVFSCNITAKDKGTKPGSSAKSPAKPPTRSVTKSAKKPQLTPTITPSIFRYNTTFTTEYFIEEMLPNRFPLESVNMPNWMV
jgi:hypothetical protein